MKRAYGAERGLTLIEIMVVLVILGIVMTFLGSKIFGAGDKAKARITKLKMQEIAQAIEQYRMEYNSIPQSLQDLTQCNQVTGPDCVPVYKQEGDDLNDAWGNSFEYRTQNNGRAYRISSFGADGRSGGDGVDYDAFHEGP